MCGFDGRGATFGQGGPGGGVGEDVFPARRPKMRTRRDVFRTNSPGSAIDDHVNKCRWRAHLWRLGVAMRLASYGVNLMALVGPAIRSINSENALVLLRYELSSP